MKQKRRRSHPRIYGWSAAGAVLAARPQDVVRLFLRADRVPHLGDILREFSSQKKPYSVVSDDELDAVAGSQHHEGIVVEAPLPPHPVAWAQGPGQWLLLDGVRNPHNLGAILRSSAHFGVAGVRAIDGPRLGGAAMRVAEGGAEVVPYEAVELQAALQALPRHGVFGTRGRPDSESLHRVPLEPCTVWVLGSEARGIRPQVARRVHRWVAIPGTGRVESLNVAAAATLVCSEYARRGPA